MRIIKAYLLVAIILKSGFLLAQSSSEEAQTVAIPTEQNESSSSKTAAPNEVSESIESSVDSISNMLETNIPKAVEVIEDDSTLDETALKQTSSQDKANYNNIRSNDFKSNLGIVQKSYLTKTGRFQIFGGLTLIPTEVYYRTYGGQVNLAYHLNETYGLNLFGYFFTSSARSEIHDLENVQNVSVKSLVYLKSYSGASLYLNTIYGKMTYFNQKIIPFETYFNIGAGKVETKTTSNATGFHAGIGNLFYTSPNAGVKVDLNWVFYTSKNINNQNQNSNSILLTVGYSGFFPGSAKR